MYDLIIIGAGPAGLSAAVYAKRAGLDLLVIEQSAMSGGQVLNTYEVDNYLGMPGMNGFDMGAAFRKHADKLGAAFKTAQVLSITTDTNTTDANTKNAGTTDANTTDANTKNAGTADAGTTDANTTDTSITNTIDTKQDGKKVVHTRKEDLEARAVLLATGAEHARLGVPGEEEFSGRGVSYCATCDGAFYRGRTVAVVGGGDVALEDAIYLSRTCEKVYLIHRRDELRGTHILQEELKTLPNVEIVYSHVVKRILGNDMVEAVELQDVKTAEEKTLSVAGVFIAVGIRPNTGLVKELAACDEAGYVLAGEDGVTDSPGIFVAGDVRKKPLRQIATAVADGANAAVSIQQFLRNS